VLRGHEEEHEISRLPTQRSQRGIERGARGRTTVLEGRETGADPRARTRRRSRGDAIGGHW